MLQGVLEHPDRSVGSRSLDPDLQVDLIEAQSGYPRLWWLELDVRLELSDSRQVRQTIRVVYQVSERDERVGLAAAVVDREFSVRLVGPSPLAACKRP